MKTYRTAPFAFLDMKLSTFFASAQVLKLLGALVLSSFILQPSSLVAAPSPQLIPFQGSLLNPSGEPHPNGQYAITFALYDGPVGGTPVWTERHEKVGVINGTVNVFLGSISPFLNTTWSNSVNFGTTKYLGITVDADGNPATADKEMAPRQIVLTSFYAPTTDKLQGYGWDMLFGSQNPSTSTIQLSKVPTLTLEATPQIPGSKLATDLVKNAIAASGQSVVNSGTIVMSPNANDASLISAGFTNLGSAQIGGGVKQIKTPPLVPRMSASVAWTGSELLVWGGSSDSTAYNDGARYNPTTETWSLLSTVGAPTGRRAEDISIWTGNKLIIWGGYNFVNAAGTGAIYDPVVNAWTTMTTTGAPSQRFSFAHVWTGTKYLVWGGLQRISSVDTDVGNGAIYDPTNNTWTPMTPVNAPSARLNTGYAWTGTEMFVWGGFVNGTGTRLNTGGLYNPLTNTWRAISTVGAPIARENPYVVWTGSRIFVWGGNSGGSNSGGALYNPTTDLWENITNSGVISDRRKGLGVWTGSSFLYAFGITSGSTVLADGGNYSIATGSWPTQETNYTGRFHGGTVWCPSLGGAFYIGGNYNLTANNQTNEAFFVTPQNILYLYQKQ